MGFEEQQQFTAAVGNSLDPTVEWRCYRIGNSGDVWLTDGAGTITSAGLYTSTDVPSHDADGVSPVRHYLVQAVSETDPTAPGGTASTFVTVVPGPPPQITSLSATSGNEGATITLNGSGFVDHSWQPVVSFSGRIATIVGTPTATQVSVKVPSGWYTTGTTAYGYVGVTTCGQSSTNSIAFTVTGLLPSPPDIFSVGNQDGYYGCTAASPGDTLTVFGHNFSHTAANNVFDFGGQTATALSWAAEPDSTFERVTVTIPVTAPVGATMRVKRTDGQVGWSATANFTVVAKTVVTLDASSFSHLIDPAGVNHVIGALSSDTWIVRGSGFTSLRANGYGSGHFNVLVTVGAQTWSAEAWALSDTTAVCAVGSSLGAVSDAVGAGDTVSIRVSGMELINGFTRTSTSVSVPVAAEAVFGGTHNVTVPFTNQTLELSKGDMLELDCSQTTRHYVTAPGFWTGTLPMAYPWGATPGIATKLLHFTTAGTYTLTDTTAGTTLTIHVHEGGAPDLQVMWWSSDDLTHPWWTEDFVMAGGGARVTIPAGTLVPEPGYASYRLGIEKAANGVTGYDPTLSDFGGHYNIQLYAKHLHHPITVQLPYDPAGRHGGAAICMYDAASGIYYQLGGTVDSTEHTVTYTIPAGTYPETAPAGVSSPVANKAAQAAQAAQQRTAAGASTWTGDQPLPALPLYQLLGSTAVVSSAVEPGVLVDETNRIRVEYCADPASSSYVSTAYANELLTVAQNTYANLKGHGWLPPTDWVVIYVRDHGPISPSHAIGTQGATTKGVFGQPYVYVNSNCTTGTQLDTAVSHEMGHVFERQRTTNILTSWIDEAVADWVAFDTLGSGADLSPSIKQGNDFAAVQLPTGFTQGYTVEQAYAAGAFIIWMAQTYGPGSVLSIYDQLTLQPDNWWNATYSVLGTATGATMADLVGGFGPAYWRQDYAPVKGLELASAHVVKLSTDWKGVTDTAVRAPYSSSRVTLGATDDFKAALTGSDLYVSATGLVGLQTVEIYGDTAAAQATPGAGLVKIATLTAAAPNKFIGRYGTYGCYRCIEVNCSALTAANIALTIEPVRVDTVSPLTAAASGGSSVTLSGRGFGTVKGYVMVGAAIVQNAAISTWSDTSITFTLPNMSGQTGAQDVVVHPATGVQSNTRTLTLY